MKHVLKIKHIILSLIFIVLNHTLIAQIGFIDSQQALGKDGYGCAISDLNNDGYPDIYISKADLGYDQVWFNDGNGVFSNSGQNIGSAVKRDRCVGIADLNGNGFPDVFIANDQIGNPTGCPNEVWLNDGTGMFSDSGQRLGNFGSSEVALSDMDNDGDIDAVVANLHDLAGNNQPNEIWLNDGDAIFTKVEVNLGECAYGLTLADINNDGKMDIIFDCVIWVNNGNMSFTKSIQTFENSLRLYFGDFDSDGDQDALVLKGGPHGDQPNEIWLNDGSGIFTDSGQKLGNSCAYSAAVADFDGDEDLDIYVANGFFNKIESDALWINQGGKQNGSRGIFKDSGLMFPPTRSWEVKTGDLDNDGDIDVFVTNGWGNHEDNKIHINVSDTSSTGLGYMDEASPENFKLLQNYPNPCPVGKQAFNPSTVITHQLNESSNTKLIIYDTLGREIKNLVNSFQSVGEYSAVWDSANKNNNPVKFGSLFLLTYY